MCEQDTHRKVGCLVRRWNSLVNLGFNTVWTPYELSSVEAVGWCCSEHPRLWLTATSGRERNPASGTGLDSEVWGLHMIEALVRGSNRGRIRLPFLVRSPTASTEVRDVVKRVWPTDAFEATVTCWKA